MPELEAVWSCIHELHLPPAERGDPLKYNRRVSTDAGFWRALRWWHSALTSDRGEIRRVVHADAPVVQQWSDASAAGSSSTTRTACPLRSRSVAAPPSLPRSSPSS